MRRLLLAGTTIIYFASLIAPVRAAPSSRCSVVAAPTGTLQEALDKLFPGEAAPGTSSGAADASLPGSPSFESMLIEGLTKFVIDRARQEALAFVLDTIKTHVCKKGSDAAVMFERTCAMFAAADDAATSVVPGRTFQDAIVGDLRAVPWKLAERLDAEAPKLTEPQRKLATSLSHALRLSDDIACGLERRQSPLPLVAQVLAKYAVASDHSAAIRVVAAMLAQADATTIQRWIAEPELFAQDLLRAVRGYIALQVRAEIDKVRAALSGALPGDSTLLREALEITAALADLIGPGSYKDALAALRGRMTALSQQAAAMAGAAAVELRAVIADLIAIADTVSKLIDDPSTAPVGIQTMTAAAKNLGQHLATLKQKVDVLVKADAAWAPVAPLVTNLVDAAKAIEKTPWNKQWNEIAEKYRLYVAPLVPHALAVHAAVRAYRAAGDDGAKRQALRDMLDAGLGLAEQVVTHELCQTMQADQTCPVGATVSAAIRTARMFLSGDYSRGIASLTEMFAQVGNVGDSDAYKELKRFGALFAEIAAAKSGDDIVAALEMAAAPLGSWRLRRKKATYGLSARAGFGGGYEHLDRSHMLDNNGGTFGLHLPIVLDAWTDGGWPIGFGLQILDLGTIASVGFGTDSTNVKPDVGIVEVLAPGVTLSLGLGNSPFVLSLTGSWSPALREDTMGSQDSHATWRYIAAISVDIPIFMW